MSLLNMPLPPLSPGVSISGPFLPTLLLLGRAGTSMIRGVFAPPLEMSTTTGAGLSGARVLGARLLLLALEGAIDMLVCLFLLLLLLGREPADVLEESERT